MHSPEAALAKFGAVVAVLSALFSFYQWRETVNQNSISAAVDLSKIYLTTEGLARGFAFFLDEGKYSETPGQFGALLPTRLHIDFLEYVASLANKGKIDNGYVSARIKCDIWALATSYGERMKSVSRQTSNISEYIRAGRHRGCFR